MDKEQLLLEITKLEALNFQAFEVIKGYQAVIQQNLKAIQILKDKISQFYEKPGKVL